MAPGHAQAFESLRRGDLVDEMKVDVQKIGLIAGGPGPDHVGIPQLLGESTGWHGGPSLYRPAWGRISTRVTTAWATWLVSCPQK